MSRQVPIEIFNIARSQVDREEVKRWLDFIGTPEDFELPDDSAISNPALLVALAAKRCYKSFDPSMNSNLTQVRKDWVDYLDNVMKQRHGSVLEHAVHTFAFENVSRVFTAEMNRHRAGWAISEGSLRFIRFSEDLPYWEPDSIKGPDVLAKPERIPLGEWSFDDLYDVLTREDEGPDIRLALSTVEQKNHATRILLARQFEDQQVWYKVLEAIWKDELAPGSTFKRKKELTSLFRRGIGMGVATGGVWSGNVRALRHVMTMRCEPAAEEEILHVFSRVAKMMVEKEPALFGDFHLTESGHWAPKYNKI